MKICFLCHGNICRSVAAEVIAKQYIKENNIDGIEVFSRALSNEEYGNDIYFPMKKTLIENGYKPDHHFAQKISQKEVDESDYIFYMDKYNLELINWYFPNDINKFHLLSEFSDQKYIEDPWYTNRFSYVFNQIKIATFAILEHFKN